MDFEEAADELYGVTPGEFVARRKELVDAARTAGDSALAKRIGELRRPTVSAWAVNLLARSAADELDALLAAGAGLREAWAAGEPLGDWERRRADAVAAGARAAARLTEEAGQPLGATAQREVEETLEAAIVDPEAAEAVAAGRLIRSLSYVGFAAPAGPPPQRATAKTTKPRAKAEDPEVVLRKLEAEAAEAEQTLDARQEAVAEWRTHLDTAQRELAEAEAEEVRLKREVEAARKRRQTAETRVRTSDREHTQAQRAAEAAARHATEARHRLEAARQKATSE